MNIRDADHARTLLREACERYHLDRDKCRNIVAQVQRWQYTEAERLRYHPEVTALVYAFERVKWAFGQGAVFREAQIRGILDVGQEPWSVVAGAVQRGRL